MRNQRHALSSLQGKPEFNGRAPDLSRVKNAAGELVPAEPLELGKAPHQPRRHPTDAEWAFGLKVRKYLRDNPQELEKLQGHAPAEKRLTLKGVLASMKARRDDATMRRLAEDAAQVLGLSEGA